MSRDVVDQICRNLPGAHWGDHREGSLGTWKVGDKMFAQIGMRADGVSVKTATIEAAEFLIDMGRARKAPYFHRSWVRIDWGTVPYDELRDRVLTSYGIVRAGLTKKAQAALGPWPPKDSAG